MWVEVIGLPGVGKTTLLGRYLTKIAKTHCIVKSNNPTIAQKLYTKYLYFSQFKHRFKNAKLEKKLAYRAGFRLFKKKKNIFFYDSGLLQVLIEHLIETDFDDLQVSMSIRPHLAVSQAVIFFKDNIEDIIRREYNREARRFNLSEKELNVRYIRAQKIIENEILPYIPNVYLVEVANFTEEELINIFENSKH